MTRPEWTSRIETATRFDTQDVDDAHETLVRMGHDEAGVDTLAPIAAWAHAWEAPLDETTACVADCLALSDLALADVPIVLDTLESLQEGEPRPPEDSQ